MNFVLPEESRNRLIQTANLIKKGFAKWEKLPRKTRNIVAGAAFVGTGLIVPKIIFMGAISSVFLGRHLYLNGEVEGAANEIIVEKSACGPDCGCDDTKSVIDADFGHP